MKARPASWRALAGSALLWLTVSTALPAVAVKDPTHNLHVLQGSTKGLIQCFEESKSGAESDFVGCLYAFETDGELHIDWAWETENLGPVHLTTDPALLEVDLSKGVRMSLTVTLPDGSGELAIEVRRYAPPSYTGAISLGHWRFGGYVLRSDSKVVAFPHEADGSLNGEPIRGCEYDSSPLWVGAVDGELHSSPYRGSTAIVYEQIGFWDQC